MPLVSAVSLPRSTLCCFALSILLLCAVFRADQSTYPALSPRLSALLSVPSLLIRPAIVMPPSTKPHHHRAHHHHHDIAPASAPAPAPAAAPAPASVVVPVSSKPSKKQVGNAGWMLIHSIAATYPHAPSDLEQYHAKAFLKSIAKLYPCKMCRKHFDRYIAASPPDLTTRDTFVLWACQAHNDVNRRNGKADFPCQIPNIDKRWGDCGCQRKK